MPVPIKNTHAPRGAARMLYRFPIWVFRLRPFHLAHLGMREAKERV